MLPPAELEQLVEGGLLDFPEGMPRGAEPPPLPEALPQPPAGYRAALGLYDDWPKARGVYANPARTVSLQVNVGTDHLKLTTGEPSGDIGRAFLRALGLLQHVSRGLKQYEAAQLAGLGAREWALRGVAAAAAAEAEAAEGAADVAGRLRHRQLAEGESVILTENDNNDSKISI